MSPQLIYAIAGLVISVATISQVAPSLSVALESRQVEAGLSKEQTLVQQIIQFRSLEGAFPADVAELTSRGYWSASNNDNGFGGSYSFSVDEAKGVVAVSTTIADAASRSLYLANAQRTFRGKEGQGGVITTTFVMPATGSSGIPIQVAGSSRVVSSATAPDPSAAGYWYDTSGSTAVMKISNGAAWVAQEGLSAGAAAGDALAAPTAANTVSDPDALPATAQDGEVRYVFNPASRTLDTLIYYAGTWNQSVSTVAASTNPNNYVVTIRPAILPVFYMGDPIGYDFSASTATSVFTSNGVPVSVDRSKYFFASVGSLPAGVRFEGAPGVLAGPATAKTPPSGSPVKFLVSYLGAYGQQTFNLRVAPPSLKVKAFSPGLDHSCAISIADALYCWGANASGQLGLGDSTPRDVPTLVPGFASGVKSVSAGHGHTCAVKSAGDVYCWGSNSQGQIGTPKSTATSSSPVAVSSIAAAAKSVSVGRDFSCALMESGSAMCWGLNASGQLGDGGATSRATAAPVSGAGGLESIYSGTSHTCAIVASNGRIGCWGFGASGQTSQDTTNKTSFFLVNTSTRATSMHLGDAHSCALLTNGEVWCWGQGASGQLGRGNATSSNTAAQATLFPGVNSSIGGGLNSTCVTVATTNQVSCSGSGQFTPGSTSLTSSVATSSAIDFYPEVAGAMVSSKRTSPCMRTSINAARCVEDPANALTESW